MRIFIKLYWKTTLAAVLIFYLSVVKVSFGMAHLFSIFGWPHFDKFVHFMLYAMLSTTFCFDVVRSYGWNFLKNAGVAFLLPAVYGGLMELLQEYFFPPRTGDWFDFLADSIGALVAFIIFGVLFKKK